MIREARQFQNILKKLTPTKAVHSAYLSRVHDFQLRYEEIISRREHRKALKYLPHFKLKKSRLFNLEYLVGYADSHWLSSVAPHFDAIMAADLKFFDELVCPPVVLVPKSRERSTGKYFISVFEHEVVHINQEILGRSLELFSGGPSKLQKMLMRYMAREFEANFLQYSAWPQPKVVPSNISLHQWCAIRGYTQGLEAIIKACGEGRVAADSAIKCFRKIAPVATKELESLGVDQNTAFELGKRTRSLVGNAAWIMSKVRPEEHQFPILKVMQWGIFEDGKLNFPTLA